MKLSHNVDLLSERRTYTTAEITTEHPASNGLPVIVLPDGAALDLLRWVTFEFRVERATPEEWEKLSHIFRRVGTDRR
jgi:hypothetical protein